MALHPAGASNDQRMHLAIDGKALKSTGEQTYGGNAPQQHVLHLYEAESGVVLQQIPIGPKTNEVGALKPFLTEVTCKGRVITADAAQSYHEMTRLIKRAGGEVILVIKENTPGARADLELFFEDPQADQHTWQSYLQVEKGHGRLERRWIRCSPDLNGFFFHDWGEVGQVFRLQQERIVKGEQSCEVIYGLTTPANASVFPRTASPLHPSALESGESSSLASRCLVGRGPMPCPLSCGHGNACCAQYRRSFFYEFPSGLYGRSSVAPVCLSLTGSASLVASRLLRNPASIVEVNIFGHLEHGIMKHN
jgi:hypothetical protein